MQTRKKIINSDRNKTVTPDRYDTYMNKLRYDMILIMMGYK